MVLACLLHKNISIIILQGYKACCGVQSIQQEQHFLPPPLHLASTSLLPPFHLLAHPIQTINTHQVVIYFDLRNYCFEM